MWKKRWISKLEDLCTEASIQGDLETAACAQALASAIKGDYVGLIHDRFVPFVREREQEAMNE